MDRAAPRRAMADARRVAGRRVTAACVARAAAGERAMCERDRAGPLSGRAALRASSTARVLLFFAFVVY